MIRCRFEKKAGALTGFSLAGHAGYAEEGSDIVCAAVSAACDLTIHLAESYFGCAPAVCEGDGRISFQARESAGDADRLLQGFLDYLREVERGYGAFIQIQITEV